METKIEDKTEVLEENVPSQPQPLTPAAQRALAEAEERRRQADVPKTEQVKEHGGREGPDPVRYGDWENGGIVSDF